MSDPWGETSSAQPHQPRPSGPSYNPPPPGSPYGQQPSNSPYGQQPGGSPYGQQPAGSPYSQQPSGSPYAPPPAQTPPAKKKSFFRDPLSIGLVVVIVLALSGAGLVGAELWARNYGENKVALAACRIVDDDVSVSFGATPFLYQYLTNHYSDVTVTTAGNQIRSIKGMKAQIHIDDITIEDSADSKGTIGALDATLTLSTGGLNETVRTEIPVVGGLIDVTTNSSDGTFELSVPLASVIVKPTVSNGVITMEVEDQSGLASILGKDDVQTGLDKISSELSDNLPLGIKADSIAVNDQGVVAQFSTKNAKIPKDGLGGSGSSSDSSSETPAVCKQYE